MNSAVKNVVYDTLRLLGRHTKSHIIVFESDDWGSIRVPSKDALRIYRKLHPDFEPHHFQSYDGLEKGEDYEALKDVLLSHENENGHTPIITLNFAMANPLFSDEALARREFTYESIQETYKRYDGGSNSFLDKLLEDMREGNCLFQPQLHGREHLNATTWMNGAFSDDALMDAFLLEMVGVMSGRYSDMDALNSSNNAIDREEYIRDSMRMFKEVFGFISKSFIPPCYVLDAKCKSILKEEGVQVIQGSWTNNVPNKDGSLKRRVQLMGRKNLQGQVCLVRNCDFEPAKSLFAGKTVEECVESSFGEIRNAFNANQPAIICSHRVNYSSCVSAQNRDMSLEALDKLLSKIQQTYPDAEYMSSDALGLMLE